MIHPVKMICDHSSDFDLNTSFSFKMNSTMAIKKICKMTLKHEGSKSLNFRYLMVFWSH